MRRHTHLHPQANSISPFCTIYYSSASHHNWNQKLCSKNVNIILHAGIGGVGEVKWTIHISVHKSRSIQQFGTMNVCNFIRNYITLVSLSCTITVNAHLNIVTEKMPYNKTNETQESYRLLLIRDILLLHVKIKQDPTKQ